MLKDPDIIKLVLLVLGGGAFYLGLEIGFVWLMGIGLFLLAALAGFIGAQDIIHMHAVEIESNSNRKRTYTGAAAILGGVGFLMLAGAGAFVGLVLIAGAWQPFWSYLQRQPGVALLVIGVALLAGGAKYLIGPREERRAKWKTIRRGLPNRLMGAALALIGLLGVLAGALAVLAPAAFDRWFGWLF